MLEMNFFFVWGGFFSLKHCKFLTRDFFSVES